MEARTRTATTALREGAPGERRPERTAPRTWQRPRAEVVCLACEISAYAPDEGEPLF